MTNDFLEILQNFEKINKLGYIESISKFKNGSGLTFEKEIGATAENFCYPDYNGIEIKTIRKYSFASINLFSSVPDGSYIYPTKWIAENYGYPDSDYPSIKVLKGDVFYDKFKNIGLFYCYKLSIDNKTQRIILEIYNNKKELIDNSIFWDFDSIQKKLELKLNKLAIIETNSNKVNGKTYYKYDSIKLYTLKSFDVFLKLIKQGIIYISFNIGVTKSGKNVGKICDHGTSFKISKYSIEKLFDRIY